MLRLRIVEQDPVGGITPEQRKCAIPIVQELLTTFDSWLVQNKLGAFPKIGEIDTWAWWWETIVGYFKTYPLLVDWLEETAREGRKEYSPWLYEAKEEAKKRN